MKDKIVIIIMSLVCGVMLFFSVNSCSFNNKIANISDNIDLNIRNCKIESEIDNHSGLLGDGEYFAKIICGDKEDNEITSTWEKLPLSEELQKAMDLKKCNDETCKDTFDEYGIPKLEKGYYNFLDRRMGVRNKKSDQELNDKNSYNFSVAIYDSNNKTIYYYELDT